jgi:hypothetical protein
MIERNGVRRATGAALRTLRAAGAALLGAGVGADLLVHGPAGLPLPPHLAHGAVLAGMVVVLAGVLAEGLTLAVPAPPDRSEG